MKKINLNCLLHLKKKESFSLEAYNVTEAQPNLKEDGNNTEAYVNWTYDVSAEAQPELWQFGLSLADVIQVIEITKAWIVLESG